jgi:hypothetical protein
MEGRAPQLAIAQAASPTLVKDGILYATRAWIVRQLTEGWSLEAASFWLGMRPMIPRVRQHRTLVYYEAATFLQKFVASKSLRKGRLRPSVSRVLQGSGSINEKLLEFVAANE